MNSYCISWKKNCRKCLI